MTRLRQAHTDGRIGYRRTENRDLGPVRGRQDAVVAGVIPELLPELVEELTCRVRPALELQNERGDPLVVLAELVFAGEGVVYPIDPLGRQRRVVQRRRSDEVAPPARLV